MGASMADVRARLRHWCELQPPDRFLLIEPDVELRHIAATEIAAAVPEMHIDTCALNEKEIAKHLEGAVPIIFSSKEKAARKLLPHGGDLIVLHATSVPKSIAHWLPARRDLLVGVASRWPEFLHTSKTMLVAAGFHADTLIICATPANPTGRAASPPPAPSSATSPPHPLCQKVRCPSPSPSSAIPPSPTSNATATS